MKTYITEKNSEELAAISSIPWKTMQPILNAVEINLLAICSIYKQGNNNGGEVEEEITGLHCGLICAKLTICLFFT